MTAHADWDVEKQRLAQVLHIVEQQLDDARRVAGDYAGRAKEERRSLWEDGARSVTSYEDWIELAQSSVNMGQGERSIAFYQALAHRLERMQDSPYFGRLDFRENSAEQADRIYIGISGLHDGTSGDLVVYDWRAPVCSLFYDAEPGPASYECQAGIVSGDMLLKRQYRIAHGNLEFMFDTDLKIDDDILQEMLGRNIDEKMRTIVTSIQREQNRVIRDNKHNLLLVQGPAGSGKTAIALHRAAYLLYSQRDSINARNIVIFSPNQVFSDYISAVLPELGEENVVQTTFHEYAEKYLGGQAPVEDMYSQLESLLAVTDQKRRDARVAAIQYKASAHFRQILQRYIAYLESGSGTKFYTVATHGQVVLSKEEMAALFTRHADLPLAKRLEKIRQRVLFLLAPLEEARLKEWRERLSALPDPMLNWEIRQESKRRTKEEFGPLKGQLAAWAVFDVFAAYKRLFTDNNLYAQLAGSDGVPAQWDNICSQTLAGLANGRVPYEDATPLLYLKRFLEGAPVLSAVRHVIIDEAQDYTPLQYELLNHLFPRCSFTVLGDLNQSVHPYMHIATYHEVMHALKRENGTLVTLTKSYRSTRQIMSFARTLLVQPDDVDVVRREGPVPLLRQVANVCELVDAVSRDIVDLQERGMNSIAVLCKTAAQSERICHQLQRSLDIRLITARDTHFRTGIVALPVYLAKGLEFDAVILTDADAAHYGAEHDRGLLYTACTRALHELHIYYTDTVSPLITATDELCCPANASVTGKGSPMK